MKLRQNAKELVLAEIDGLGLIIGEIRYNRQTETVAFALEKAAFFDLYFPCAVIYDQKQGPVVHPHILTALTTSSIRVQRSKVSCFVHEHDLSPAIFNQYHDILNAVTAQHETARSETPSSVKDPEKPGPDGGGGSRVIPINRKKGK